MLLTKEPTARVRSRGARYAAIAILLGCSIGSMGQQAEEDAVFVRALAAQQKGDFPAAIREYKELLRLNPKMNEARVNLGAALARTGQFDDAIAQYRIALAAMPESTQVQMDLGLAYYKKGDLVDAAGEFSALHDRQPGNVQVAILLGDSEVRSGKAAEAVAFLAPMEAANGSNPDFEYVMGTALLATGSRRDGAARLQKVADTTHAPDAYFLAGSTLLDLNEAELARKDLEEALRLNPQFPRIYTLTGMARDKAGDPAAAEKAFRQALQVNPNDFDANLYVGAILLKRRSLEEAKPYLDRALQVKADSTMALFMSAKWSSTSGEYAAAAKQLEAVVKQDPNWLDPHVELASVYYKLHRPEDGAKQREIVAHLTEEQQSRGPGKP